MSAREWAADICARIRPILGHDREGGADHVDTLLEPV